MCYHSKQDTKTVSIIVKIEKSLEGRIIYTFFAYTVCIDSANLHKSTRIPTYTQIDTHIDTRTHNLYNMHT